MKPAEGYDRMPSKAFLRFGRRCDLARHNVLIDCVRGCLSDPDCKGIAEPDVAILTSFCAPYLELP